MPSPSDQTFNVSIRSLLSNARWALKRIWATSPPLTAGLIAATVIRSFMPAALALTARELINDVVSVVDKGTGDYRALLPWLALGLAFALVQAVSEFAAKFFTQRLHDELNLDITSDILTHASRLDVEFFEDPRLQDVMERAQQNTAGHFSQFATHTLTTVTNVIQMVSLAAILITIEPFIAVTLAAIGIPYFIFQWRFTRALYLKEHLRTTKRRWTRYFTSRMTGRQTVAEIKLLDLAPVLFNQFRSIMTAFRDENRKLYVQGFAINSIFAVLATAALYGTFVWVVLRALEGGLTVGDVAIYGGAVLGLRKAFESTVLSINHDLEQALYTSNLREFLSLKPRITDASGLTPLSSRGEIEFKNVSFSYPGSVQPVLSDVSFRVRPGEAVALVGENGAGKTTLIKLIARLYDPDQGCILFDGIALRELSLSYLRGQLSFVLQHFGRYEATAADNIAYGDWRRLMNDRGAVEQVTRRADMHDMIEAMPQGYDTQLGRMFGEYDLSEGQWQRIAVARAFARDAALIILDEPTSNLDARAEYRIFSRFRELARGRTTIFISHRFSTVSMADRILVMDKGRIVECGTHQELLSRSGYYSNLYDLHQRQMSGTVAK